MDNLEIIKFIKEKNIKKYDDLILFINSNINITKYEKYKLILIYNNFIEKVENDELVDECRSIILDYNMNLVNYTFDNVIYNNYAKDYILKNNPKQINITECYEGPLISIFFYNNNWFMSTKKKIINMSKRYTKNKIFNLFFETIINIDEFLNILDKNNNYQFILLHHKNKNIVNYNDYFNDNEYKKIVIINIFNKLNNNEIDVNEFIIKMDYIIIPRKYSDLNIIDINNNKNKLELPVLLEGLVIEIKKGMKKKILKFQSNSYKILNEINFNEYLNYNIYVIFIDLYKKDKLKNYIEYFPENIQTNISNTKLVETISMIDAIFKVFTSELFEIFRLLYDLKSCNHKNTNIYKNLENEYAIVLYKIRGIYYKKKENFIKQKDDNFEKNYFFNLKICDIYNLLKKDYDINSLIKLFISRKKLLSKNDFSENIISSKCDPNHLKMATVLIDLINK